MYVIKYLFQAASQRIVNADIDLSENDEPVIVFVELDCDCADIVVKVLHIPGERDVLVKEEPFSADYEFVQSGDYF